MFGVIKGLIIMLIFLYLTEVKVDSSKVKTYKRVCYYTNWAQYRASPGKLLPQDIDPFLCTHLVFAFAKFDNNGHLASTGWNDIAYTNLYKEFNKLKVNNTELKTLLAIGGWTMGSSPFTAMVKTQATRQNFISRAAGFLRKYNFDGLDLDWEYPATRGSPPEDKHRFSKLVKELRYSFSKEAVKSGKRRLLISAAVGNSPEKIDLSYDVPIISKYLDFINLMTYDLHGGWEKMMQINAPLYPRTVDIGTPAEKVTVSWIVKRWIELGASPQKLILGIPIYGRGFTFCTNRITPGSPNCGKSKPGSFTKEKGILAFSEIKQYLDNGWKRRWDKEQMVPYAYNMQEKQWVGYDDEQSIKMKIDYLKRYQLGGAMTWALSLDSFDNTKDKTTRFTLHRAIKQILQDSNSENTRTTAEKTTLSYSLWNKPKQATESIPYKQSTKNVMGNGLSSTLISLLEEPPVHSVTDRTSRNTRTQPTSMEPNIFITESQKNNLEQKRKTGQQTISTTDQPDDETMSFTNQNLITTYSSTLTPEQYQTSPPILFGYSDRNLINNPVLEVVFPGQNNGNDRETSKKFHKQYEYNIKSDVNIFPGNGDKYFSLKKEQSLQLKQGHPALNLHTTSKVPSSPPTSESENILPCDEESETSEDKLKQEDSLKEVFKCPSLFGIYRDVTDCTSFFQCVWQVPFHYKCSPGTAWNDRIQSCDWPSNTGCIL